MPLLKNVARSLKPQGRLGIVDFFPGGRRPGPAPDERVDPEAVIQRRRAPGRRSAARARAVPPFQFQYLLVFGKANSSRVSQ